MKRTSFVVAWFVFTVIGMAFLWHYESVPGAIGAVPAQLQQALPTTSGDGRYTLIIALHPHCPCSRATIRELNRIIARCPSQLRIEAYFVRPAPMTADWVQTDLWRDMALVPGATLHVDPDGKMCHLLGAETSGQVMLYSPAGKLLFEGGITSERGHEGDNAGSDAIVNAVVAQQQDAAAPVKTPVYGCPIQDDTPFAKCPVEAPDK